MNRRDVLKSLALAAVPAIPLAKLGSKKAPEMRLIGNRERPVFPFYEAKRLNTKPTCPICDYEAAKKTCFIPSPEEAFTTIVKNQYDYLKFNEVSDLQKRVLLKTTLSTWNPYNGANILYDIASVQPLTAPNEIKEYFGYDGTLHYQSMSAGTLKLKTAIDINACQDLKAVHGLEPEDELATIFSHEIKYRDLLSNILLRISHTSSCIYLKRKDLEKYIERNCQDYDYLLNLDYENEHPFGDIKNTYGKEAYNIGCYKNLCSPDRLKPALLLWRKQISSDYKIAVPGTILSPYVFISRPEITLDPNAFCPRYNYFTRIAIHVVSPHLYHRIIIV